MKAFLRSLFVNPELEKQMSDLVAEASETLKNTNKTMENLSEASSKMADTKDILILSAVGLIAVGYALGVSAQKNEQQSQK